MTSFLLLAFTLSAASAAEYIELAGNWDRLNLPLATNDVTKPVTLEKTVEVGEGADLALVLGNLPPFQVRANGILLGTGRGPAILPLKGFHGKVHLQIELKPGWRSSYDRGPYVIANRTLAERLHGDAVAANQRAHMPDMVLATIRLMVAAGLFLVWLSARDQDVFLWLSVHSFVLSWALVRRFAQTVPGAELLIETYPNVLAPALILQFSMAGLDWNPRSMRLLLWCTVLAGQILDYFATVPVDLARAFITAASFLSAAAIWRGPESRRQSGVLILLFTLLFHVNAFGVLPLHTAVGPWFIRTTTAIDTIAAGVVAAFFLLRLTKHRSESIRLSNELQAASEVQRLLLAGAKPPSGFHYESSYFPATEVGGDFHYALANEQSFVLVAGDVSGKGLRAAMLVTLIIGALRRTTERRPAAVLAELNRVLVGQTSGGFVTCCCAAFGTDGSLTIANAGHLAPYVDGHCVELEPGLPLGIVEHVSYVEQEVHGSRTTFVSDGVVEAANRSGELFGFERTQQISNESATAIAETAKAWGQNDDITVVTVRRV